MRGVAARVLVASLVGLGVAQAGADPSPGSSSDLGRAIGELVRRHRSLEATQDPAALADAVSLLERIERAPATSVPEREDRELARARLEAAIERGLDLAAGRPSKLRTGAPPEPGSDAEARLARRIERAARAVNDLLPDEVAAARSDLHAEKETFARGPVAQALDGLERALDGVAPVMTKSVRDYLRVLRAQASWRGSVDELVALAEQESKECGERMEAIAVRCGAGSAAGLVERLKEDGLREDPIVVAREEAMRSARFAHEHELFTIPEEIVETLRVDEGDPRARTPFGHYIPVGWRGNEGHYVVTAMTGADAGAVSRRRESFRFMIRGVAAHEGVPGHHLHFATAARSGDALRKMSYEGATTEGWGLFVEGVLSRAGYFDEPLEASLTPVRMRRWRADRVILDAGLQTGRLTREQAIARLQRDCCFDRPTATDEVDRYRERAGYYAGYLLGARTFEAAERRARARGGEVAARSLRDRVLALGPAAPLRAVKRLLDDH